MEMNAEGGPQRAVEVSFVAESPSHVLSQSPRQTPPASARGRAAPCPQAAPHTGAAGSAALNHPLRVKARRGAPVPASQAPSPLTCVSVTSMH